MKSLWCLGFFAPWSLCVGGAMADEPDVPPPPPVDQSALLEMLDEPVIATASKSAESQSATPATSISISADDLRRFGIHSLDEAINYLSVGMLTQNPLHAVDIGARGVLLTADYGNHVLLLLDGHALNEQWDGTAYFERGTAVPLEIVDHIEIILGPGSVLYGSNAMLGVINIITKRAKDFAGLHLVGESELVTSGRVAAGFGHAFALLGMPAELTAEIEYYAQKGPTFTFGPQDYGDDSTTNLPKAFSSSGPATGIWGGHADQSYYADVPAMVARLVVGDLDVGVRAASYKRATPYVNQFNMTSGDFNDPGNYEQDRWLSLDAKYKTMLSAVADFNARLYGDLYQYDQHLVISAPEDCLEGETGGCYQHSLGLSRWAGLEMQTRFDWLQDSRLVTLLGADGRLRYVGSQAEFRDQSTHTLDGTLGRFRHNERALGVYAQQTLQLWQVLALNGGIRLDADDRFGHHFSPRAAAAIEPWSGGALKAIYAEAFRAPTSYETSYSDLSEIAGGGLRPEQVRSIEGVAEQRVFGQRLAVSVFESWWSDMVVLGPAPGDAVTSAIAAGATVSDPQSTTQYRNVGRIHSSGFSAQIEGSVLSGDLRYGVSATSAKSRRSSPDGGTQRLTVTPERFANAHVFYRLPNGLPGVGLAAVFFDQRPADRAFDADPPFNPRPHAPYDIEMRLTLTGVVPGVTGLSYRASANYTTAARGPYVVGPNQAGTDLQPAAELNPVDRFRVAVGIQYDVF